MAVDNIAHQIIITDITGKNIYSKQNGNEIYKVDISEFAAGIYLMKINYWNYSKTFRIVKR